MVLINLSVKRDNKLSVFSNLLILLFTAIALVKYQYDKDLSPELLLFFIQIILLWFLLKIILSYFPDIKDFILIALLIWGVVEAVWGMGQLYNFFPAKHTLFKTTGSFLNPGPYGGFIALMFPISLYYWLNFRNKNVWISYIFLFLGVVCLLVFPATMSRSAWIAALTGFAVVLFFDKSINRNISSFWKQNKKRGIIIVIITILLFIFSLYAIYHIKKDSADGRLFMWKITTLAIKDTDMKGVGIGGFPASYASAQIDYFKSGESSETERFVAGSPEYAFNEYLQIFLEQGIWGFIVFILLSITIIYSGIKNREYGAVGSFISLSVFALASYPYQLWQFPVVWVILGTLCTYGKKRKRAVTGVLSVAALCIISGICFSGQNVFIKAKQEWSKLSPLYNIKAYENVVDEYRLLYPTLNHNAGFVFEYGMSLNATGDFNNADSVYSRGLEISSDAMFYNVKGRNYHEMAEFNKAEICYINSTWLLPERIYPYYLLTKLYADSLNYKPDRMKRFAKMVMEKEPKVESMAVREMRNEVEKLLKEKKEL